MRRTTDHPDSLAVLALHGRTKPVGSRMGREEGRLLGRCCSEQQCVESGVAKATIRRNGNITRRVGLQHLVRHGKFYDSIPLTGVMQWARQREFNPRILAMAMQMHMAPRRLRAGRAHSETTQPTRSIIAGCKQSNRFARAVLYDILQDLHEQRPAEIRQFVDDLSQTSRGKESTVAESSANTAEYLITRLRQRDLRESKAKTYIVASSKRLTLNVQNRIAHQCGMQLPIATAMRDLGVDATAGTRRSTKVSHARIAAGRIRTSRVRFLSKANWQAQKLYKTGTKPATTYGIEAAGAPPGTIRELRRQAADSTGVGGKKMPNDDHRTRLGRGGRPGHRDSDKASDKLDADVGRGRTTTEEANQESMGQTEKQDIQTPTTLVPGSWANRSNHCYPGRLRVDTRSPRHVETERRLVEVDRGCEQRSTLTSPPRRHPRKTLEGRRRALGRTRSRRWNRLDHSEAIHPMAPKERQRKRGSNHEGSDGRRYVVAGKENAGQHHYR